MSEIMSERLRGLAPRPENCGLRKRDLEAEAAATLAQIDKATSEPPQWVGDGYGFEVVYLSENDPADLLVLKALKEAGWRLSDKGITRTRLFVGSEWELATDEAGEANV